MRISFPAKNADEHRSEMKIEPAPPVAKVAQGAPRPLWSVMIPTYNCAKYLRETLETVLAQDPGPEEMQIEVVDDCSTRDDPEAVVREIGKGRVSFYRKPANAGAIANFNTCIERSRGHLVHILHGDDYVLPGFYDRIGRLARENRDYAIFACRVFVVNAEGIIEMVNPRALGLEGGGRATAPFFFGTPVQFAGVVVRRSFYEEYGGFRLELVHCADWEMWARAWSHCGGIALPDVLASYRVFEGNDTSRLKVTGENLKDQLRCYRVLSTYMGDFPMPAALRNLSFEALAQQEQMAGLGNRQGHAAAREFYQSIAPLAYRCRVGLRRAARTAFRFALSPGKMGGAF